MKVVIFGASGGVGFNAVKQGLERGHVVTAAVRNPEKFNLKHPNLIVKKCDVFNLESVTEAIKGNEVVFSALGSKTPKKFDPVTSKGITNMIIAMEKSNLKNIIAISGIGMGDPKEYNWFVRNIVVELMYKKFARFQYEDMDKMEKILEQSNVDWVILRPTTYTNGKIKGKYHLSTDTKYGTRWHISRADVADCMLNLAESKTHIRQHLQVGY
jgi:putative NADH-flavin reductase